MRLLVLSAIALALAACSQPPATKGATPFAEAASAASTEIAAASGGSGAQLCPDGVSEPGQEFHARECRIEGNSQSFDVKYAEEPANAQGGALTIDVMTPANAHAQTLSETNVSEYLTPLVTDVDGDGAEDVLIGRESGNVNTNYAFWRNVNGHFVRLGEVSGVAFKRTVDGYLAVPARSSAAEWDVDFYRVDATALTPLVTLDVTAEADARGHVTHTTCIVSKAPGLALLHLTRAAARAKFCAEPAARVFD